MNRLSLKTRLTLWYILILAVFSAVLLAAVTSFSYEMVERDARDRLIKSVDGMTRVMSGELPKGPGRMGDGRKFYMDGVHMLAMNEDKEIIGGQIPFSITDELDFKDGKIRKETYDGNQYMVFDRVIKDREGKTVYIKGMVSIKEAGYAVNSILKTNIIIIILLIIIAAVGGYMITARALKPVDKMSKTAKSIIESKDLSRRINAGKGSDEIVTLANTFDNMLDEIQTSFEREKQFTSDASHELRTPIAVILSECEYMTDCAETVEELRESAEAVKGEADKMSKLVSELLMIARMDKDTLKPDFEETDISELSEFIASEQQAINPPDISLEKNITPGIIAKADKFLIARVFINLISNAYKYNRENGSITVSLKEDNGNVIFSVKDSGIGISEENLPKIWERFFQVDPSRTSNENGSMGLGLSMVRWIAEKHGGNITVSSKLGEGSEFTFVFPKKQDNG